MRSPLLHRRTYDEVREYCPIIDAWLLTISLGDLAHSFRDV
jgi:hypothetical protein